MSINWELQCKKTDKRRAFAWAKFYELANEEHNRDYNHYTTINRIVVGELDEHIKKQLIEMGAELKKTWECPICLDFIEKDNLDITPCGHYYCKGCLATLKQQRNCACALCRKVLKSN